MIITQYKIKFPRKKKKRLKKQGQYPQYVAECVMENHATGSLKYILFGKPCPNNKPIK